MATGQRTGDALPKTIAFITDARAWGGAEVYLTQVMTGLRGAGLDPHLFCADRREVDPWIEELRRGGIRVELYRPTKEWNPLGIAIARACLAGYELVHINKTHARNSLPAVIAARLAGAAVLVTTEHLAIPVVSRFPFGQAIIEGLVRWTNRFVDRTIAVSELSREMLIENYRVPPSQIAAIRNGIDLSPFEAEFDTAGIRAELGLEPRDRVAIFVGRMTERKGHTFALRAVPSILESVPGFRLLLVGEGELEENLRTQARELGIAGNVIFAGFRRDIPELLASSDLLMLPSESECLPITILEAMASGLPVVATDVGGVSEEVEDGVTGYLVEPRDPHALAEAVVKTLGSRDGGASMGAAGRRKAASEFGIEACVASVISLYEDLLAARGAA
jgi:glycosyltransferase involved in cell wall biosynthesis